MFNSSLLPPAQFEFVVIADTHYMLNPGDRALEFESRRKQSARSGVALKLAASLDADFIVHLGDLIQEYPETERYTRAIAEARQQLAQCGIEPHHVAGNQDIGDKPDATMPTLPVTPESLNRFHTLYGPSWYSFDHANCHFIVINTQILNTNLPELQTQRNWLEQDLKSHQDKRTFLFLHLPPFLYHPEEPHLGNYDNIGQSDRGWLLDLIRKYAIEILCAGHVHFAFFNRIGPTRFYNVPSTSFTRPGFSHLFTGPPPPEQGRDDAPKLGFYLYRVFSERTDAHFIRTSGALTLPEATSKTTRRLLTRTSAGIPHSPLGLTLLHPLAPVTEIPVAYPTVIRQRVRNDYPLLAGVELGATAARFPSSDLDDPIQKKRLAVLRDEGLKLTAVHLWSPQTRLQTLGEQHKDHIDGWEIQIPGAVLPPDELCQEIKACHKTINLALTAVLPGEHQPGKQHPRTRIGYLPEELSKLNRFLADRDLHIDRAICRIAGVDPWKTVQALRDLGRLSHIGAIDLSIALTSLDDADNANRAAEALFSTALLPGTRAYFEPLIDFDRTMDVSHGLLDTLCNPRPAFHVMRCLNTILYGVPLAEQTLRPTEKQIEGLKIRTLTGPGQTYHLLIAQHGLDLQAHHIAPLDLPIDPPLRLFHLAEGTVQTGTADQILSLPKTWTSPLLLTTASDES